MTGRNEVRLDTLARELAAGKTVEQAMLAAGYAAKTAKQGRIRHRGANVSPHNHPDVAARMGEIRAAARKDSRLTIGDIVAKLEQCFNGAIEDRQWSAACQAAMSQAKALGLIVDRKAIGIKPIDSMSEAELAALIGEDPDREGG